MPSINAYPIQPFGSIEVGNPKRDWMDATAKSFAYACLPLLMGNQLGWDLLCETSFKARWDGTNKINAIEIVFNNADNPANKQVLTHFGYGILTFNPGFLFTTTDGNNLLVKGVPNQLKDGIQALEAIVETDWLPFTFTMNWKFTRKKHWIRFEKGEPMCRIVPYPRHYIESFDPSINALSSNPALQNKMQTWVQSREEHNKQVKVGTAEKITEKTYLQGKHKDGQRVACHQNKIVLKGFEKGK